MTTYHYMIRANHYLIKGGELTVAQQKKAAAQLLSGRTGAEQARRFYRGVKYPNNIDGEGRRMYPVYYIPPYNNGKKLKTVFGQTPKTHILSANMYELEILRLLYILTPDDPVVADMVRQTLGRLKTTCFGYQDDGLGECFDTSLVVLRFLAAVSEDKSWMQSRIDSYNHRAGEKKRSRHSLWYFWLCLSELPLAIAEPALSKHKDDIFTRLTTKRAAMNNEQDTILQPIKLCTLRNCLCRFPEYSYIKDIQPTVSEADGRLRFDMTSR